MCAQTLQETRESFLASLSEMTDIGKDFQVALDFFAYVNQLPLKEEQKSELNRRYRKLHQRLMNMATLFNSFGKLAIAGPPKSELEAARQSVAFGIILGSVIKED